MILLIPFYHAFRKAQAVKPANFTGLFWCRITKGAVKMGENVEKTREKMMEAVENASEEALRLLYAFVLGLTG